MHFESPRGLESSKSEVINMGSYVDSTINPLESPDIEFREHMMGRNASLKYHDNSGGELKLRTNRISEVPNENSDCETSSPIKEKDLKVLETTPNLYTS
jgi:hypothetical protein